MPYLADLHNHSCLSPCAWLELSPGRLVQEAKLKGISLLALTDHNTCRNLPAFQACCKEASLVPIFGMEVTSAEEAHILTLFEDIETAMAYGKKVEDSLPNILHDPIRFGDQVYVNKDEEILGEVEKTLFGASSFDIDTIVDDVTALGGLVIPAHIDRPAMSISSQFGYLPDLNYAAVESVSHTPIFAIAERTLITSSDAHKPDEVGMRPFWVHHKTPSFVSLSQALQCGNISLIKKG